MEFISIKVCLYGEGRGPNAHTSTAHAKTGIILLPVKNQTTTVDSSTPKTYGHRIFALWLIRINISGIVAFIVGVNPRRICSTFGVNGRNHAAIVDIRGLRF